MAEQGKKQDTGKISDQQRFRYIGFDVYPGKPKDLFRSEAERNKLVDRIRSKRESGERIREECQLFEDRVSLTDRLVLTLASVVIVASLFLPWFSAYNERVTEAKAQPPATEPAAMVTEGGDSLAMATGADTAALGAATEGTEPGQPAETGEAAATEEPGTGEAIEEEPATGEPAAAAGATEDPDRGEGVRSFREEGSSEEILVSTHSRKKIERDYERVTGLGTLASIGSAGSLVFSSGFILMLTYVMVLVYVLLCVALPAYTLYGLYGTKGDPDTRALKLKKVLKLSWIPVLLFVAMLIISFVGADYGFDPARYFTSIGDNYSVATFAGALSWGVIVTLCAFILSAFKGVEI